MYMYMYVYTVHVRVGSEATPKPDRIETEMVELTDLDGDQTHGHQVSRPDIYQLITTQASSSVSLSHAVSFGHLTSLTTYSLMSCD